MLHLKDIAQPTFIYLQVIVLITEGYQEISSSLLNKLLEKKYFCNLQLLYLSEKYRIIINN